MYDRSLMNTKAIETTIEPCFAHAHDHRAYASSPRAASTPIKAHDADDLPSSTAACHRIRPSWEGVGCRFGISGVPLNGHQTDKPANGGFCDPDDRNRRLEACMHTAHMQPGMTFDAERSLYVIDFRVRPNRYEQRWP